MCCFGDFSSCEKSAGSWSVLQLLTVTTFYLFLQVRPRWHPEVQKRSNGQQKVLGRLWLEWPGPNRAWGLEVCDYNDEQLWQDGRVSEVSESWRAVLHLSSWGYQVLAEGRGCQPRWFDANADGAVTGQYWTMFNQHLRSDLFPLSYKIICSGWLGDWRKPATGMVHEARQVRAFCNFTNFERDLNMCSDTCVVPGNCPEYFVEWWWCFDMFDVSSIRQVQG